jgi:Na+/melibiose symporter-like transporter
MGHPGVPSSRSRFVSLGIAYVVCFFIFMGLVLILEPRSRGSHWRGWEVVAFGIFGLAMVLFLVGITLLAWAFGRDLSSRSKLGSFAETFQGSGVWDRQLDGQERSAGRIGDPPGSDCCLNLPILSE